MVAGEKAGIIKRNVPVVIAPQPDEALEVFLEVTADRQAPVVQVGKDVLWSKRDAGVDGQSFDVTGLMGSYELWLPLIGGHQLENACTSIAAVEVLLDRGLVLPDDAIREGLKRVSWPGRLQMLAREGKRIIVDGAHNPYSTKRLVNAIREHFEFRRVVLIFGATTGHSAREMLTELSNLDPRVIAVRSRHPRSAPVKSIASAAREAGMPVLFESENIAEAIERALDMAGQEDLVLGTGSLSVVAEIIEQVNGIDPELYPSLKRPAVFPNV